MSLTHPAVRRSHDGSAHDELVDLLDQQVREVVRREGVDPQRDAALVRRIAEGVVRDHDDRSLTGMVAPVPDVGAMVGELVARVSGFGPLQPFLDDPAVEEIWINDPSRVFIARHGRHELTTLVLTSAQVQELVERMLSPAVAAWTSASRSSTRCCRRGIACTSCSRGSAGGSQRSTSASLRTPHKTTSDLREYLHDASPVREESAPESASSSSGCRAKASTSAGASSYPRSCFIDASSAAWRTTSNFRVSPSIEARNRPLRSRWVSCANLRTLVGAARRRCSRRMLTSARAAERSSRRAARVSGFVPNPRISAEARRARCTASRNPT